MYSNKTITKSSSSENTILARNAATVDSTELANQFTTFLNNLEKLTLENSELISKNNELEKKTVVQENMLKDYLFLANSVGKIHTVLEQLQSWLATNNQTKPNKQTPKEYNNSVCSFKYQRQRLQKKSFICHVLSYIGVNTCQKEN
jgi:hypothetical protein